MRIVLCCLLLMAALAETSVAEIVINEIHADPPFDESLTEWIELYNNGTSAVNLSNWIFGDSSDNDTITGALFNGAGTVLQPNSYAILTDDATRVYENFNVSPYAIHLYLDDSGLGNGLNNSGETIYLYNLTGALIHSLTYNSTTESLSWALINNSILSLQNPTPGYNNNGTIEVLNTTSTDCDWANELTLSDVYGNPEDFIWKFRSYKLYGQSTNLTATANITDLSGSIIQDYNPFTNHTASESKTSSTYSPNIARGVYYLELFLQASCSDKNLSNNYIKKLFAIKPEKYNNSRIDVISIQDLGSDKKAKFGQMIKAKLDVYRGNTTKTSIALKITDGKNSISKESRASIDTQYVNTTVTVPIQLIPNCEGKFEDGDYLIEIEGLGIIKYQSIDIGGIEEDNCEEIKVVKETISENKESKEEKYHLEHPEIIVPNSEFKIKLKIKNDLKEEHNYEIYSYIYRGPKSYSGEREQNKISVLISPNQERLVELKNKVDNAETGLYKLKAVIKRDDRKTPEEITKDIPIIKEIQPTIKENNDADQQSSQLNPTGKPTLTQLRLNALEELITEPELIYQSPSFRSKEIASIFAMSGMLVLIMALLFKRI